MISIPGKTFKRLRQARARLETAAILNPDAYPEWLRDGPLSMRKMIDYLLDLRDADLARRARNKRKETTTTDMDNPTREE